MQRILM